MVKEDSFGLFGRVGRRRGGCWRKEERGGGPGEGAGEREGVAEEAGAKEEARGRGGKWRPGEGGRRAA